MSEGEAGKPQAVGSQVRIAGGLEALLAFPGGSASLEQIEDGLWRQFGYLERREQEAEELIARGG